MCTHSPIINIINITKQYPGSKKKANNNINLQIYKGEILCIAGENGAGKTTLMKILSGLESADSGEIVFNEKTTVGMVHQHLTLFPEYTAAQNIVMGREPVKYKFFFDNKKANECARKIIEDNNFSIKSGDVVKNLTLGQMQQTEICRVLYQNANLIILDEPTSILTEEETQSLFLTMRRLVKDGKTIIFITHKMKEITRISDRVVVLKDGKLIDDQRITRINANEEINRSNNSRPFVSFDDKNKIIEFKNVTVRRHNQKLPLLDNVSFAVHSGEILGFTGTGGNGLGVIEAVFGGFLHPVKGRVLHKGKDISRLNIRKLRENGLAFVPSDRKLYGSAAQATLEDNLIILGRDNFYKNGFLNKKEARRFSDKLLREYNILGEADDLVSTLSGGNLQKLILAREINSITDYIVFSEPAWGLDLASADFIMKEIVRLRDNGAAVILISTNSEEVYALADRVIVMEKGKMKGVREVRGVKELV